MFIIQELATVDALYVWAVINSMVTNTAHVGYWALGYQIVILVIFIHITVKDVFRECINLEKWSFLLFPHKNH